MSHERLELIFGPGRQVVVTNGVVVRSSLMIFDLLIMLTVDGQSISVLFVGIIRDTVLGQMIRKFSTVHLFFVVNEEHFSQG